MNEYLRKWSDLMSDFEQNLSELHVKLAEADLLIKNCTYQKLIYLKIGKLSIHRLVGEPTRFDISYCAVSLKPRDTYPWSFAKLQELNSELKEITVDKIINVWGESRE